MSDSFWLAVRPIDNATSDDVIRDASAICGRRFEPTGYSEGEYIIPSKGGPVILDLTYGHDDEGDLNDPAPFGYFPWHFSIDDARSPEWSATKLRIIRDLHDGLVATGRYECFVQRLSTEEILASNVTRRRPRDPDEAESEGAGG